MLLFLIFPHNVEAQLQRLAVVNANSISVEATVTTFDHAMRLWSTLSTRTNVYIISFASRCFFEFTPVFASAVALVCLKNTHLKQLHLTYQRAWHQSSLRLLCNALAVHQSLRLLDLSGNALNCEHAAALANLLQLNTPLRGLCLSGNLIACAGARALANALYNNTHLVQLRLNCNKVDTDGAHALAAYLAHKHAALQVLWLHDNFCADNGTFERALRTNANLLELRLDRLVQRLTPQSSLALQRNASARRRVDQHALRARRLYASLTLLLRSSRVFNDLRQDVHGSMAAICVYLQRDLRALALHTF